MKWILKTERLLLRELTENDFDFMLEIDTRPENSIYEMEGIPDKDKVIESCKEFIEEASKLPQGGAVKFIICNENSERVGTVSLHCNWDKTKEWEIGYKLLSEYWGRGYASEALTKVIEFAFKELSIHKLIAFINYENKRSVALANRIGMVQEACLREGRLVNGKWNDELVFTVLKKDLK